MRYATAAMLLLSRPPPRPRLARGATLAAPDEGLAFRVRDAILDSEEKPFLVWSEKGPTPLKANLDLLTYRAKVLDRRGDMDGAKDTLEYCCRIDPNDGRAWLHRARLAERAGRLDESQELLQEGLRWEPSSCYLLQAHGALQQRRGRSDEALELYCAAARSNPRHAPSWVSLGLLLEQRRQPDAAAVCFQLASGVAPRSYFVWQVLGEWRKRRGELGSAREAYRRSLQFNKRNAATFHAWGVLEWRCGHHELATQLFRKGLEVSPRNRYLLQTWACMEARVGQSDEAAMRFARAGKRSKRMAGGDGATWQARAMQHKAEGRLSRARDAFSRGVAVDPRHVPLYHAWAQLECDHYNTSAARALYQRGVWASRNERETTSLWSAWALLEERAGEVDQVSWLGSGRNPMRAPQVRAPQVRAPQMRAPE